ncbi:non-heme iron oxygenase ferredoxin subunit [Pseudomonas syringae group genomosp. 3]|uniref:non-heme iron oxygenase ferredoxin subunit n=1 Tax=Pseudomonas syringae group genomosp. 3 TaxID=251701 RepID=UPI000F004E3C|nr:non-heme iron oxygenase ferredoxin subunit [Pseudomonas syringae group genomosp. 3]
MRWLEACTSNDIELGDVKQISIGGELIAVYHIDDGFFATQDTCTHAVASLADGYVDGDFIECPLHAAKFCIKSGAARSSPASVALATYPVKIEENKILIGFDEIEG